MSEQQNPESCPKCDNTGKVVLKETDEGPIVAYCTCPLGMEIAERDIKEFMDAREGESS